MNLKNHLMPSFHYEISFPDFEPSDPVKHDIERHLAKLESLFARIISCHVAVRSPHMHKRKHVYHIILRLEIPGEDLVVSSEPEKNFAHSDIHIAIRDAFNALHRQLRKRVKSRQRKSPSPDTHEHGFVKSFNPAKGYGFIATPEGREVYFHKNSLINGDLEYLNNGTKVRFLEEPGEKGQQVTSMSVVSVTPEKDVS